MPTYDEVRKDMMEVDILHQMRASLPGGAHARVIFSFLSSPPPKTQQLCHSQYVREVCWTLGGSTRPCVQMIHFAVWRYDDSTETSGQQPNADCCDVSTLPPILPVCLDQAPLRTRGLKCFSRRGCHTDDCRGRQGPQREEWLVPICDQEAHHSLLSEPHVHRSLFEERPQEGRRVGQVYPGEYVFGTAPQWQFVLLVLPRTATCCHASVFAWSGCVCLVKTHLRDSQRPPPPSWITRPRVVAVCCRPGVCDNIQPTL